jgi:hypothetical protein
MFLGELKYGYQTLIHKVKTVLQSEVHQRELAQEDKIHSDKIKEYDKEISETINEIRIKKNEFSKADNSLIKKQKRWKLYRIVVFVIVFCDIAISSSAIQQMNYSLITSIFLGATIGTCILLISEHLRRIIDLGKTPKQKKIIAIIIFSFLFLVFYILGYFRSLGIDSDSISASPIYFAVIQMFFLITASLTAYINKPTQAEYKIIDVYQTIEEELVTLEKSKTNLQKEKQAELVQKKEIEETKRRLIQYHTDLELQINSKWKQAYQEYCSINMFSRSDNQIPTFFNQEAKDLTFYFHTKKPN